MSVSISTFSIHSEFELTFLSTAPILDDVEIPIYSMTMNGTVWPSPNPNFSRQPPSAENDEEWNTYEEVPTFKATREQILKLGKNPDTIARFDDDHWGFGPETYMIQLDVIHVSQVELKPALRGCLCHCLANDIHPANTLPKQTQTTGILNISRL